jgi:hypothetical protein
MELDAKALTHGDLPIVHDQEASTSTLMAGMGGGLRRSSQH